LYRKFEELASKGLMIPQGSVTVTTNNRTKWAIRYTRTFISINLNIY
jgi:hypothetical protein